MERFEVQTKEIYVVDGRRFDYYDEALKYSKISELAYEGLKLLKLDIVIIVLIKQYLLKI